MISGGRLRSLLIVPTYNERDNLRSLAEKIFSASLKVDVLVVDDDSPDGTGEVGEELAGQYQHFQILHRKNDRGYGKACLEGFKRAVQQRYDYICTMDADLSHDPSELKNLLARLDEYDVVIGSRYAEGGKMEVDWSLFRRAVSRLGSAFARFMLGLSLKDCTSGYRCYKRKVLESLDLDKIGSEGYSLLMEILYLCQQKGFRIGEAPIIYVDRQRGKSKLNRRVILEALFFVLKNGLRRIVLKYS
ncbi:dolichol-phosphate mannosyltransferase [Candidatus Hakubella thermalkaliphila]|uniref:Dolichol-phosphate mannosyltransferase n=3 Tax=Candidatus Hakubella thermalkaliphila TaxID=2754717 RepID=A0A6V8PFY6_9ACTN|nr:dolichol-phosphate mannosyltransferase [Candidatus Hakubella thermalkaliphila]GFP29796.1 dolichol-phosphate mannosyltransferase [Candidatus Hakubella thermalkaliphila]GFP37197.1 dolichol-phosphate mannosyltransferase [Candidatus Hakubella thermalkaliphila]GFP38929.1 dolichol-phosphate mannosyltransferase [Candidatus Hakubella thermalkaliphila]GFP42375.1 dolichol-phosphate mannosyltransferase [Candidatus Hakubella thermalkaliphila]